MKPHDLSLRRRRSFGGEGLAIVVPLLISAEPDEACPPSPRLRRTPARIHPRPDSRGFLRRRVRRTIGAWACVLAAAAVFGFAGCRTVQGLTVKPQVQSVTVVMSSFDLRTITLRFDVELLNPGDGEMNVAGVEHELQIEGRSFTAGTSHNGFALAPHGTALVSLPVTLALADLQRTLAALKSRREVSYRLAVTLLIDTPLGAFRFPLTKDGCVSMFPPSAHSCQ